MNKFKTGCAVALCFAILCSCGFMLFACNKNPENTYTPVSGLDTTTPVSLKIAIPTESDKALSNTVVGFMRTYPNVTVEIDYFESIDTAVQRIKNPDATDAYDMILSSDQYNYNKEIDAETNVVSYPGDTDNYFYNFASDTEVGIADTAQYITSNFRHTQEIGESSAEYLHSIPLGGAVRGMFVNKKLLAKYNLSIPTNYTEFLNCCKVLKDNGYTPIQGNPSTAAVSLGLPEGFRDVVNDPVAYEKLRTVATDVSSIFTKTMSKMYELATLRYYDYKAIESKTITYLDENGAVAKDAEGNPKTVTQRFNKNEYEYFLAFLGLVMTPEMTVAKQANEKDEIAFFPYLSTAALTMDEIIDRYDLDFDYTFVCPPMNDNGEKSAGYITPGNAISINKNSANLIWAREFVNYILYNIGEYAAEANIIPNSKDAAQVFAKKYGIGEEDVVLCGQVYFDDDYNAYNPFSKGLVDVFKCSAPKYMVALNKDANGNPTYLVDDTGKEYIKNGDNVKIYKEYIGAEDPLKPGYACSKLEYYIELMDTKQFNSYRR